MKDDIRDICRRLSRLEGWFRSDMNRNPNFHSDLSDNVEILGDIITDFEKLLGGN